MNKKNEKLKALLARYENDETDNDSLFLSEEEFDELLSHNYEQQDYDRTLEVANLAIPQHRFSPGFYK